MIPKNRNDLAKTILVALLFAFLFMAIGEMVPRAYYTHANTDNFYEVKSTIVEDAYEGSTHHNIILISEVSVSRVAFALKELRDNESQIYTQFSNPVILEKRDKNTPIIIPFPLPEGLPVGEYYWDITLEIKLPYNIFRIVEWKSETFEIKPKE